MTLTSSSAPAMSSTVSAPTLTTSAPGAAAPGPVDLISQVAAEIVRSSDPEAVFGSLAVAYARASGAHCTVELLIGTTVRLIQAPEAPDGNSRQPTLSPVARQLLAGDGAPLQAADWLALFIGAATSPGSADIPIGVFTCRFSGGRTGYDHLPPARYLIGLATEVLDTESRLAKAQTQVVNLEIALGSNRDIGTAIGILMNSHLVTQDEAFTMLRLASQHSHRKLREVANDVIFTGALVPLPPRSRA